MPTANPIHRFHGLSAVIVCAGLSSLLLYVCYFPVAWGFLGWVALVPLLALVRSPARPRWIYWSAYACGLLFFLPVVQWMRVADPRMYFTWIGLSIYCSGYFPVAIWLLRSLDRQARVDLVVAIPIVWTALEMMRGYLGGGFAWYLLAYTQHDFLTLIQLADVTGPFGITFLVAACNAVLFAWLYRLGMVRRWLGAVGPAAPGRRPLLVFQSALVLLAFAGCLLYGSWRLQQYRPEPGPRVASLQGNIPQQIRIDRNSPDVTVKDNARTSMLRHYGELARLGARLDQVVDQRPHLIIWPETSFPLDWEVVDSPLPDEQLPQSYQLRRKWSRDIADEISKRAHTHVMLGLNTTESKPERERDRRFNSALLLDPKGKPLGRYDKIHRVPFGEYVPFRESIPLINRLAPYDFDYSIAAGEGQYRIPLGDYRLGVIICYEDTDPRLAREYVDPAQGEKTHFLVNISNDGWFDGTAEHEEHLAICRWRAIESRRAIIRSVNMGITALIDGNGQVLLARQTTQEEENRIWEITPGETEPLPMREWGAFKKVPGVLFATIPLDDRASWYARWGDWLPVLCWVLLLLMLCLRRRSPA